MARHIVPCLVLATSASLAHSAGPSWHGQQPSQFEMCGAKQILRLDDAVSPADVVARGVLATCRGLLPREALQDAALLARVEAALTAAVLEHRQASRQRSRPRPQPL